MSPVQTICLFHSAISALPAPVRVLIWNNLVASKTEVFLFLAFSRQRHWLYGNCGKLALSKLFCRLHTIGCIVHILPKCMMMEGWPSPRSDLVCLSVCFDVWHGQLVLWASDPLAFLAPSLFSYAFRKKIRPMFWIHKALIQHYLTF